MRIWFFKALTEEYQTQTEQRGYEPHFIPVLDQIYTSDALAQFLQHGPATRPVHGIIITSQRSVTALVKANHELSHHQRQGWQGIPLYIVGETTRKKLQQALKDELFFLPDQTEPHIVTKDHASALKDHLLEQLGSQQQQQQRLLFLAGDKRRDELPQSLTKAGYDIHEIQTYHTCRHHDLPKQLDHHCISKDSNNNSSDTHTSDDWSVYFSPSGANYILSLQSSLWNTKIAAIGHTTANQLQTLGYHVHAVATKPDAMHLLDAIIDYDNDQHS